MRKGRYTVSLTDGVKKVRKVLTCFTLSETIFGWVLRVKEHPNENQDSWFFT